MNFPVTNGPSGPHYTIAHFRSSQATLDYRDPASTEGKLRAAWVADVAKDPAWSFTLHGRFQSEERRKAVLVIGWKGDTESVGPSWTSTLVASTSPPQSPFTPLLPLLDSPPRILHVAFRPPLSRVDVHPTVPTDMLTLYIPVRVDGAELATFGRQIHSFQTSFARVSHEPAREMVSASRGWGMEVDERGEKGVEDDDACLVAWKSKDDELRDKSKVGDEYERLPLRPLREAEGLGVEWEEERVLLEPIYGERREEGKGCCGAM